MNTKEQLTAVEDAVEQVKQGKTKKVIGDTWIVFKSNDKTVGIYLNHDPAQSGGGS